MFLSQRSNTRSMSSVFHFCSLVSLPADASFLGAILLPSFPHLIFLAVVFCLGPTENKVGTVTHLITHLTKPLPPNSCTFIKSAKKGGLDFSFFIFSDTFQVIGFLAFLAVYPLGTINSICIHNTITNMLHFKPHLVLGLHTAYITLPAIQFHTFGMLIVIKVLGKFHSKEEIASG